MKLKRILTAMLLSVFAGFFLSQTVSVDASEGVDVIAASSASDWFQNEKAEGQGVWTATSEKVSVDAFGCNYAMEGATYLTNKGTAFGAYEFETTIKITELNSVENPMVGIIPWYQDKDNYLSLQIKFSNASKYLTTDAEKADGYGIEQLIFSGKYQGEGKYISQTSQQENSTYDALSFASLNSAKVNPLHSEGHKLKIKFEARSSLALSYICTIYYNDTQIATTDAYFYNAIAKNVNVGFMAQDVKAEFSNAYVNDFYATHKTTALARDWKDNNDFTYRVLNGVDVWNFNDDGSITFNTASTTVDGNKSEYKVSGSNIAGYDTNRGFTDNVYKEKDGLPQNYEVKASFKLNELINTNNAVQGFGLIPWYKDDINFVYVTFRRTKGLLKTTNEIILSGWVEYSSAEAGKNVYELPSDFDMTAEHTLRVQKKSNRFFVYLDDIEEPILSKQIKGTELNYYYGYEGYNANYTASPIEAKAIYESYDEIAVVDENNTSWRVSGESNDSWEFVDSKIHLSAKDNDNVLSTRSYILGLSDICDTNMTVSVDANIQLGDCYYSELMLSPYIFDEYNFARIGIVWKNGKVYARVHASTYGEDDDEPKITMVESEISAIDLTNSINVTAEKIDDTLALYVNGELIYGRVVENIKTKSVDYGLYVYNMDIEINEFATIGYKKYEIFEVGDWTTSGMKYNEWTIDENGYLIGDGTYTPDMEKDDEDGERNFALQKNELATNGEAYEITATIKCGKQSEAEDRLGVVMWYVDDDNFMLFYIDQWRSDSTVPRTTIYGKLNGETLPTTFNHGGWFPEGDKVLENGLTITENSQVTQWHTISVRKEGNVFTCYVDTPNCGYISYVVEAGLPSTDGKDVYSGIYTYNDEIICSSYDVTSIGGFTTPTLPCEPGNPYNASVSAPVLGSYSEKNFEDEFVLGGGGEVVEDTTKPTVNITTNTTATAGDEITISYNATDDTTTSDKLVCVVTVTKNGSNVTLTNNKFVAEEGTYVVTVKVTDEAGNETTVSIEIVVSAANEEPTTPDDPTIPDDPTTPTDPVEPAPSKGCGGSAIASIFGMVALVGVLLVAKKRKED